LSESKVTVYGIPNCDTIKKTLDWFKAHDQPVTFHDYKKDSISKEKLTEWSKAAGWEKLLNKKSTTWRGLSLAEQEKVTTQASAIKLMQHHNSIIKRPVIEADGKLLVGFDEKLMAETFS